MSANRSIKSLLEAGEFVWAPCIYDCVSARVAELVGHNACLISSCELEFAMNGIPAGLANWEEYIWATERICNSTSLPVIVDGENGGGTPMQVYRNCKRLAEVGAMAISIEDTMSGGFMVDYGYGHGRGYMDRELWATNVAAAVDAVKGTDCMIIARTDCKGGGAAQTGAIASNPFTLGLDEAILRAQLGITVMEKCFTLDALFPHQQNGLFQGFRLTAEQLDSVQPVGVGIFEQSKGLLVVKVQGLGAGHLADGPGCTVVGHQVAAGSVGQARHRGKHRPRRDLQIA